MNTVVLRTHIDPSITVGHLLTKIRAIVLDAFANQALPFEQLCRILEEEQNIQRSSLFQVLLIYYKKFIRSPHKLWFQFCSPRCKPSVGGLRNKRYDGRFDLSRARNVNEVGSECKLQTDFL